MKRIKAACITQTLCFSNHDRETTEYAKKAIVQECEKYKAQLEKSGRNYFAGKCAYGCDLHSGRTALG